jgi:photosystem II stability/assembly factor-like uncharacterized protein
MSFSSCLEITSKASRSLWPVLLSIVMSGGAAKKPVQTAQPALVPPNSISSWTKVAIPFKATQLTAVGDVFWACGDDEMIASSTDGGNSWTLRHQNSGGATLLDISFVSEKVGHAAGTKGRILSTVDGGRNWQAGNADADVQAFSFADSRNGIAVIGGDRDVDTGFYGLPATMNGKVMLTHDSGNHWEEIPTQENEDLQRFPFTLAIAALDASDYLMIRRMSGIEDVLFITHNTGKSWSAVRQRNDATNRELARWVFVHDGEYWAFGMELVHRDAGGGYSVPLTMHSKDGETWVHGTIGPKEFGGCNSQGCYMWDGTVESLYGEHEQYWALPQDGTMSNVWALIGNRACTVGEFVECGPATVTQLPQPRPSRPSQPVLTGAGKPSAAPPFRVGIPGDCAQCVLQPIAWDHQQRSVMWVTVKLSVAPDGNVKNVALSQDLGMLAPSITQQILQWRFHPSNNAEETRDVRLIVQCGFDNSECKIVPLAPQ